MEKTKHTVPLPAGTGKKGKLSQTLRLIYRYKSLYVILLFAVVWFLTFAYIPMLGNVLAFKDYSFSKGIFGSEWAGFKYFEQFFNYYDFSSVMLNTVKIALLKIFIEFPFPIIFALILNELQALRFKKVVQSVSYLPHFVSWVIVVQMFNMLLSPTNGVLNDVLVSLGAVEEPIYFMGEPGLFYPLIFFTDIFKTIGWSSIIYLAAISGINAELYEAAAIDGVSRLKMAWYITFPSILPTAGLLFILSFSGILRTGFDQIYLLQNPGNITLSETLETFVFKQGMLNGNLSFATAVGFFQSVVSLVLMVVVNKIASKTMELSLW